MTKYKYFFGSDSRSIPYLTTIFNSDKNIKVVTTPPIQKGRGKKFILNAVEEYCALRLVLLNFKLSASLAVMAMRV